MLTLLNIPQELRVVIFDLFLAQHKLVIRNTQPSNAHFALLHTCRQLRYEAGELSHFTQYVSLAHESQIVAFLASASDSYLSRILHIDVANDGRLVLGPNTLQGIPVSQLYCVLGKLVRLKRLRVFDCNRARSLNDFIPGVRIIWAFEKAMYPFDSQPCLLSYEIFVAPTTRIRLLHSISSNDLQCIRLSGFISVDEYPPGFSTIRHLTISGVTGNLFDRNIEQLFKDVPLLESFEYAQGTKLGFEIRDDFLQSLNSGSLSQLRKLVLLSCSRLSTTALTSCLQSLTSLEYFALSFITTHELKSNFILPLPVTVSVLKLKVTNAWYAFPRITEEESLCNALETTFFSRRPPPCFVYLDFRSEIISEARRDIWEAIASDAGFILQVGVWESEELI